MRSHAILQRLRRVGRVRKALLLVLVTGLLGVVATQANALPPRCPGGEPPPCDVPDPEPEPEPGPRTTTTTTSPPPATVPAPPPPPPPPPPPATWQVQVLNLVQDDGGIVEPVGAQRFFVQTPVADPSLAGPVNVPNPWITPAGESILDNGVLTFPDDPLPAGSEMVLRVTEAGSPGSLCRTAPVGAMPPSGRPLHILVAPPVTTSAAELQALVAGLPEEDVTGLPAGVTMDIVTANLTPQPDGLHLRLQGTLGVAQFNFTFDYNVGLTLRPVNGWRLQYVLSAQAVGPGTVELVSVGTPNGDHLIDLIRAELLPRMRNQVQVQATAMVNGQVHGSHDVQWWRDQGFSVSMRRVTYASTGMTVFPSLCRLG